MRASVVEHQNAVGSSPAPAALLRREKHALPTPGAPLSAAQMLSLQRSAGNRAVGALLGRGPRSLARCPGCGGTCGDEDLIEEEGQMRLRDASLARRS